MVDGKCVATLRRVRERARNCLGGERYDIRGLPYLLLYFPLLTCKNYLSFSIARVTLDQPALIFSCT
jgi:hypothetical protein